MFRKVFVVYPRGMRTGGPEALHQLVDALRAAGQDAALVPRPGTEHLERVPAYSHYDAPEASRIDDSSDCAAVTPEDIPGALARYQRVQPFCWWLSIYNAARFHDRQVLQNAWASPFPGVGERLKEIMRVPYHDLQRKVRGETTFLTRMNHLTQSKYAADFLRTKLGFESSPLSDYTPASEFDSAALRPPRQRADVVAYNPVKSGYLVEKLRPLLPGVTFQPLERMTRAEVVDALGAAAIYLDLGNHPGKDRMPREAALAGAVVVVARRGSGAFYEDVPIDDEFKVAIGSNLLVHTRDSVRRVLADRELAWQRQHSYRVAVRGERSRFNEEVVAAFEVAVRTAAQQPA